MKRIIAISIAVLCATSLLAQIGRRFPSERKVINDPKTGVELVFLTSKSGTGDSKCLALKNVVFDSTFFRARQGSDN